MNNLVRRAFKLGMVMLALTAVAVSQVDQGFVQAQQQNARALKQYRWKSRMELQKDGETKVVQVNGMRYDADGTLQKTLISTTQQQQLPTEGIRGRIAQRIKENLMQTLDSLSTLGQSYRELPPDKMQRFLSTATATADTQQRLVRIQGSAVVQPGDSMTLWVDPLARKLRRAEIQTTLDKKPVNIVSDFQDLPNGPTYAARSVVDYPSEELKIIIENIDYEQVSR